MTISTHRSASALTIAVGLAASAFLSMSPAYGGAFKVLHTFCSMQGCADGAGPAGLMQDQAGNIFGVTTDGGNSTDSGVVFELTPSGKGNYTYNVIYTFCSQDSCVDGDTPWGAPIIDASGNIYGTTAGGGADDGGTVYELTPRNGQWTLNVLYSFCEQQNCADGALPDTGLTYAGAATGTPYDGASSLYGTVTVGSNPGGSVFSLTPSHGKWSEHVLNTFNSPNQPLGTPVMDAAGNLYGTLANGGQITEGGGVYELSPKGSKWSESALYDFCSGGSCETGQSPQGSLYLDNLGRLWGTTIGGGPKCNISSGGCGTLFMLTPGQGRLVDKQRARLLP
jgi:uncharacterized repeat protein (TIGR03803 family)